MSYFSIKFIQNWRLPSLQSKHSLKLLGQVWFCIYETTKCPTASISLFENEEVTMTKRTFFLPGNQEVVSKSWTRTHVSKVCSLLWSNMSAELLLLFPSYLCPPVLFLNSILDSLFKCMNCTLQVKYHFISCFKFCDVSSIYPIYYLENLENKMQSGWKRT